MLKIAEAFLKFFSCQIRIQWIYKCYQRRCCKQWIETLQL